MKVEGSNITINDSVYNKMSIIPKGNNGKNLVDRNACLENKGLIWTGGTITAVSNNLTSDFFEVEINQNYTNNYVGGIFFYDNSKSYLGAYQVDGSIAKVGSDFRGNTFLVPNNNDIKYARIVFRGDWNDNINILTANVQTEKGLSITTYEPYKNVTGNNSVVVQNKNLIDNTNLNYSWSNVASSYIQLSTLDTGIRFESTYPAGAPVIAFKLFDLNNYIGKTIRMKSKMTSGGQYRLDLIDENATSVTLIQTATTSEQLLSYTVPNNLTDKHYLAFTLIDIVDTSRQIDFTDLILTIEDDDLTYVPHQEQSITLHLGNIQLNINDSFINESDTWKILRADGTKETITDTTLINELNGLQELLSYDDTTNITITSDTSNAQMIAEVTYTSESDMCEKLLFIFNKMKDKLYHIIRSL